MNAKSMPFNQSVHPFSFLEKHNSLYTKYRLHITNLLLKKKKEKEKEKEKQ
jgi:hypothetical protein